MDGGTGVLITGAGFQYSQSFYFGSAPAVNVHCTSSEECSMATPASSPGTVNVVTGETLAGPPGRFTFIGPAITGITPRVGPQQGGTNVYITGISLGDDMIVHFGQHQLTVSCTSDTSCVTVSPPGTGSVHLTATRAGRTTIPTPADVFTYEPFPYGKISPDHGPDSGGTVVTITGGNFSTAPGATHFVFSFDAGGPDQLPTHVSCSSTSVCTLTTPPCGNINLCSVEPSAVIKATVGGLSHGIARFTYVLTSPPPAPPPPKAPPCNPLRPDTCQ
jgi:hypothetical protein